MAVYPSNLGALVCADEASFGEDSTTYDERLPVINPTSEMAAGLEQTMIDVNPVMQYQNDGVHGARGIYGGQFTASQYLYGHGATCVDAISISDLGRSLGRWIGNNSVGQDGGTVNAGTSNIQFSLTGATVLAGGLIRVGAISDDRGNGQFYAVDNASTITVLNQLEATPSGGDVVYAAELVYPAEDDTAATVSTERYGILTANGSWDCHGCWCSGLSFSGFNAGEIPRVDATINVARWSSKASETWPTSTSVDTGTPAPCAGGSLKIAAVGTTALVAQDARDINFSVDLQCVPLLGPGADDARQGIVGVRRIRCQASLSFTVDKETGGTDTWGDAWNSSSPSYQHAMLTLSAENGSAVGIYMPKMRMVGLRPTQHDRNGLNAQTVTFQCLSGGTTTTDLTHSNFRIGLA